MNPRLQMYIDALRQRQFQPDPSMTASGQQLPPQAVLDQPIPSPVQAPSIEDVSGQPRKATSLRDLIEQRMREQEAAQQMAQ